MKNLKLELKKTLNLLQEKYNSMQEEFEILEYIDCLLSISEDLELSDYYHINYKLHNCFYEEGIWLGNDSGEFSYDYHINEEDLSSENINEVVSSAIKYLKNKYNLEV